MRSLWIPTLAALLLRAGDTALANNGAQIQEGSIPAVSCAHLLLKSNPAVQSVNLFVVDEHRSAIEFRFKGKAGNLITADLMISHGSDTMYDISIPENEPEAAGWESTDFVSSLKLSSKCYLTPAFDSVMPGPKPRAEWQQVDWPIEATSPPTPR